MINVIKASAGSGKTYTLAYEYIKLLLGIKKNGNYRLVKGADREYFKHILAVTFTNKATGEMKMRIIKGLYDLANCAPGGIGTYMDRLRSDFNAGLQPTSSDFASEDDVRTAAYNALVKLLFGYTKFNVSTIDSFFQLILRTFAREAVDKYDFDISLDEKSVTNMAVHDLFASLSDGTLDSINNINWLTKFVLDKISSSASGGGWDIFTNIEFDRGASLFAFAEELTKERFRDTRDAIVDYMRKHLLEDFKKEMETLKTDSKKEILAAANGFWTLLGNKGINEDNAGGKLQYFNKFKNVKFAPDDALPEPSDTFLNSLDADDDKLLKKAIYNKLSPSDFAAIRSNISRVIDNWGKYLFSSAIIGNLYQFGLMTELINFIQKIREENNIILISDTNDLLKKIIGKSDTPFIYERVGLMLNNFLLDEFQDTSSLQWENLKPLLNESLSRSNDNLIIGDVKQSIYRFRNADYKILQNKVDADFQGQVSTSNLDTNYRSCANVIKFNNTFFSIIADKLGVTNVYDNVCQKTLPSHPGGYVHLEAFEDGSRGAGKAEFEENVLERLPRLIDELHGRGYRYSDVAVLVNSHKEGAEIIDALLKYKAKFNAGFDIVSNDSLLLKNSPSVRFIIGNLKLLTMVTKPHVDEDMPVEGVTEKKTRKSINEKKYRLLCKFEEKLKSANSSGADGVGTALSDCFSDYPTNDSADSSADVRSLLHHESDDLSSIIDHIIALLPDDSISDDNAFIHSFQDMVLDYCASNVATVTSFLKWWDTAGESASIMLPPNDNAVNVMTIHSAKGLEFPCVIIPFCTWDLHKDDNTLWLEKADIRKCDFDISDNVIPPYFPVSMSKAKKIPALKPVVDDHGTDVLIDSLNKTYVAFTRAVNELHIFYMGKAGKESKTISDFIHDVIAVAPDAESPSSDEFRTEFDKDHTGMRMERQLADDGSTKDVEVDVTYTCVGEPTQCTHKADSDGAEMASSSEHPLGVKMQPYSVAKSAPDLKLKSYFSEPSGKSEETVEGVMYHTVFSRIRSARDVDNAVKWCRRHGVLSHDKADGDIISEVSNAVNKRCGWFADGLTVYNERSIVAGHDVHRPDRVIVTPDDHATVIDYKFGEHNEHNDAEYSRQVSGYMDLLRNSGFTAVAGYIWYPFTDEVVSVK
jgi:ATP-dependent helicase/nuclease subunit A